MNELHCKNCGCANNEYYDRRYRGLCLFCANAGIAEKNDRIEELEKQVAKLLDYVRPDHEVMK